MEQFLANNVGPLVILPPPGPVNFWGRPNTKAGIPVYTSKAPVVLKALGFDLCKMDCVKPNTLLKRSFKHWPEAL